MEATRARFGSVLEWVLAAAFIVAALVIGSLVVRQLRTVGASVPAEVIAGEPRPTALVPAGVPTRAVSVPVLLLPNGNEVRVGDSVFAIATRLGRDAEVGTQAVEPARFGDRLIRFYEYQGTRFVLVFEPFEQGGQSKVTAIYLQ
jgi:hypothetical protein